MKPFDKSSLTTKTDGTKVKVIAISVSKDIHDKISKEARIEHRSVSSQVVAILELYFEGR